jgi:LEA14-like dessication related protein
LKKLIFIFVGIIIIILVVIGIKIFGTVQKIQDSVPPEIRDVSLTWGKVTPYTTEILGTVIMFNPNTVNIPVKKVSCDIVINEFNIGSGETLGLQIKKNTEFPVKISAVFDNTRFSDVWAEHIRRDENSEVTIKLGGSVDLGVGTVTVPFTINQSFETDLLENLKNVDPVTIEKKVKVPLFGEKSVFKISLVGLSGDWGSATSQASRINLSATIYNENPYPLLVPKVRCIVESNGLRIGSGETGFLNAFEPDSTKDVEFIATLDSGLMDEWFVRHVEQGEQSQFDIRVFLGFEVDADIFKILGDDGLTVTLWQGNQEVETDILNQIR